MRADATVAVEFKESPVLDAIVPFVTTIEAYLSEVLEAYTLNAPVFKITAVVVVPAVGFVKVPVKSDTFTSPSDLAADVAGLEAIAVVEASIATAEPDVDGAEAIYRVSATASAGFVPVAAMTLVPYPAFEAGAVTTEKTPAVSAVTATSAIRCLIVLVDIYFLSLVEFEYFSISARRSC